MNELAKVIGEWRKDQITREEVLQLFPLLNHVSLRSPIINLIVKQNASTVNNWHQDYWHQDYVYRNRELCRYLLLWSNREQTQIRSLKTEKQLPDFKPYQFILVDNLRTEHRMPPVISPDRWFLRLILSAKDYDRCGWRNI